MRGGRLRGRNRRAGRDTRDRARDPAPRVHPESGRRDDERSQHLRTSAARRRPHFPSTRWRATSSRTTRHFPTCTEQTCYEQAYGNIAYYQGPKAAFALVEQQYGGGADPTATESFTPSAQRRSPATRETSRGPSPGLVDLLVGLLPRRARARLRQREVIRPGRHSARRHAGSARIDVVAPGDWLTYQCLHGLGHGLMITTGYRLPLSLKVCKRLATTGTAPRARAASSWRTSSPRTEASHRGSATTIPCTRATGSHGTTSTTATSRRRPGSSV